MEFENILKSIGEFGKFQTQVIFIFIAIIPYTWFSFCNTFYSVSTAHYCRVYDNQSFEKNSTLKICTIPYATSKPGVKMWDSCTRYRVNISEISNNSARDCLQLNGETGTLDCDNGWIYDISTFTNTQIMEFDLVCDNDWLKQLSKTTYGIGIMLGSFSYSQLSDVYGRRPTLYLSLLSGTILNSVIVFLPNFYSFIVIQFLMSFLTGGIYVVGHVLVVEIVSSQYRPFVLTVCKFGWAMGSAILGVISMGCHGDWRKVQLVIALTSLIYIPYYFIIKESARWLIQKERTEEAGKIIQEIARWNNNVCEYKLETPHKDEVTEVTKFTLLDIFRSPGLRMNATNLCFYMLSTGMLYGGMAYNSNYFSDNPYTLYMLSCLVEIPANLLGLWLLGYLPRRWLLCTTMILTGVLWTSSAFIGIHVQDVYNNGISNGNHCIYGGLPDSHEVGKQLIIHLNVDSHEVGKQLIIHLNVDSHEVDKQLITHLSVDSHEVGKQLIIHLNVNSHEVGKQLITHLSVDSHEVGKQLIIHLNVDSHEVDKQLITHLNVDSHEVGKQLIIHLNVDSHEVGKQLITHLNVDSHEVDKQLITHLNVDSHEVGNS
ncbi:organic cation transporter protein-like [Glandiceps talaboti]